MVSAVQLVPGQTRRFTRGTPTGSRIRINLARGEALVINRGPNNTIFVKCGRVRVNSTRIVNLRVGQTVVVHCR